MKISKQELLSQALETGFRPEIMEKVWYLMTILDGISVHPFLKERLVLKRHAIRSSLYQLELEIHNIDIHS